MGYGGDPTDHGTAAAATRYLFNAHMPFDM